MRQVIIDLFECINTVEDPRSKKDLATIIRREVELDLISSGVNKKEPSVSANELHLAVHASRKLEAVKSFKNRTGYSLMDSKRAVEDAMEEHYAKLREPHQQ